MQRLLTSLILIPLLVAAIFLLPHRWFLLFVLSVAELGALELVRIGRSWAPGGPLRALLVLLPLACLALMAEGPLTPGAAPTELLELGGEVLPGQALQSGALELPGGLAASFLALLLAPAAAALVLFARSPLEQALPSLGILSFGSLYLALPVVSVWRLQMADPWLVVLLLAVVGANDTCAFYFGRAFGRRKMSPRVSPKKTWVGALAGLLGGIATAALWCLIRLDGIEAPLLLLATGVTVAAQCGDLVISMLKRGAGVKDSGRLLPGHGGVLDRCDGFLFSAPILLLGLVLLGWGSAR